MIYRPERNSAKDIKEFISTLDDKEQEWIGGGYWVESNRVAYRAVLRDGNKGKVIAFIDIYMLPKYPRSGIVVLAVDKDHRGSGTATSLINKAYAYCKSHYKDEMDQLIWHADEDNKASIAMAQRLGFKFEQKDKGVYEYSKELV